MALSDPLSFVLEAFEDAWGFPAGAMLTVLSNGSQSSVAAADLAVGDRVRSVDPRGERCKRVSFHQTRCWRGPSALPGTCSSATCHYMYAANICFAMVLPTLITGI